MTALFSFFLFLWFGYHGLGIDGIACSGVECVMASYSCWLGLVLLSSAFGLEAWVTERKNDKCKICTYVC